MPVLRGEVAAIIDDTRVVLNVGKDSGVRKGFRFVIYTEVPGHLYDALGTDLGPLEIPKAEVEVIDVQEKLSIAKNTSKAEREIPSVFTPPDILSSRTITYTAPLHCGGSGKNRYRRPRHQEGGQSQTG